MHGMPKNTALVVDDELSNRVILKSLLKRFGYNVLEAGNGQSGIELFKLHNPDVVFMDVLMPGMDGYSATTQIKQLVGDRFVPVIFLTALTDEQALVHCIEAGGDDFLTKPFSHVILRSKLRALERIRSLHREIERLYDRMRLEEEIAQKVFNTAVIWKNVAMEVIPHYLHSAAIFNGDILLTAWTPSGNLHLLLGDFTGHGLSAALCAIPTATAFRTMTAKGFSPERILTAINSKLHALLPPGVFLAATFVLLPKSLEYVQVFNSSMPDALVLDENGVVCERMSSHLLPLGILRHQDMTEGQHCVKIKQGWRILLVSDGVTESSTVDGTFFGQEGIDATIQANVGSSSALEAIKQALHNFCGSSPLADDTSIVEIPCITNIFPTGTQPLPPMPTPSLAFSQTNTGNNMDDQNVIATQRWQVGLVLQGESLAKTDPIPLLISQIQDLEETTTYNKQIFELLTTLYVGLLESRLPVTSIFSAAELTDPICKLREHKQRLRILQNTTVLQIKIICEQIEDNKRLLIHIEDLNNDECKQATTTATLWLNSNR